MLGQRNVNLKNGEAVDNVTSGQFVLGPISPLSVTRPHYRGYDDAGSSDPLVELSERQRLVGQESIDIVEYDD